MSDLVALLERVKAATGPDRELDVLILCRFPFPAWSERYNDDGAKLRFFMASHPAKAACADAWRVPVITASIDAAVALIGRVLPGWDWDVGTDRHTGPGFEASVMPPKWRGEPEARGAIEATAPLALLASMLSSLIAQEASR